MMWLAPAIIESNSILLADEWGQWIHERFNAGPEGRMEGFANIIEQVTVQGINPFSSEELVNSQGKERLSFVGIPRGCHLFLPLCLIHAA